MRPRRYDKRTLQGVTPREYDAIVAGLDGKPCPEGGPKILHYLARWAEDSSTPECPGLEKVRAVQRSRGRRT